MAVVPEARLQGHGVLLDVLVLRFENDRRHEREGVGVERVPIPRVPRIVEPGADEGVATPMPVTAVRSMAFAVPALALAAYAACPASRPTTLAGLRVGCNSGSQHHCCEGEYK